MRAIDTNVIVRFLTKDDPTQAKKARSIISEGDVFIATTVLLEAEWVLRSAYAFAPSELVRAFRALAGLPGINLENSQSVARALDWTERGMDFADSLHLAMTQDCTTFLTFDKKLMKAAASIADLPVASP